MPPKVESAKVFLGFRFLPGLRVLGVWFRLHTVKKFGFGRLRLSGQKKGRRDTTQVLAKEQWQAIVPGIVMRQMPAHVCVCVCVDVVSAFS